MNENRSPGPPDIPTLLKNVRRPKKAVVTAGMPYATGPLHLGHLAGTHIPADVYARWLRMVIGAENVLFVCGTDDHGSTTELSAIKAGKKVREFLSELRETQHNTLKRYHLSLDVYSGTSFEECYEPFHRDLSQNFLRNLKKNNLLIKKSSRHWYDPKLNRFLQDRFVTGKCPNPKCENLLAYSDECEVCGMQYSPEELQQPKSALSDATPVLKDSTHWWLDMWTVSEPMRKWVLKSEKFWRQAVFNAVISNLKPTFLFDKSHEETFKEFKNTLPPHKSRYAPGKRIAVQFENKVEFEKGKEVFSKHAITVIPDDGWAYRSITRDVEWGIPLPQEWGDEIKGKTLYVWPDSLIAPISFSKVALKKKGLDPELYKDYWCNLDSDIYQFLGQDNVYFYTLMQGGLWLGQQSNPMADPAMGDFQFARNVFGNCHLMVNGEKMSKSRGNFFSGDQMLDEKKYHPDQVRYYLALLSLPEKPSNFDFSNFEERNRFLAGPMNASFEKPISACHSKYEGRVPEGVLDSKIQEETVKIVQKYLRSMERGEFSTLLFLIENYARLVNSQFTQYKPHDDRAPLEQRQNALYSCFAVLKNLVIMLHPFVPDTMEKLRQSLNLPASIYRIEELGKPMEAGHPIGAQQSYFPSVP
jgi:methionyl-tRNA synthetase